MIIVSLLSYSYFFGVIRLLIFVLHEIVTTFENSKGSTMKTFTYVKHCLIFLCRHFTTFMHFVFLLKVSAMMPSFFERQHFHSFLLSKW